MVKEEKNYVFKVRKDDIERIVRINDVFTNAHEEDSSQNVTGLAYLGAGGVAFLTDQKELRCLFGPRLEEPAPAPIQQ